MKTSDVARMAEQYYPIYWSQKRIEALVTAGKLTRKQADNIYKKRGASEG